MNAKMKFAALSASVLAALVSVPAHAYVYADAALEVKNLHITFGNLAAGTVGVTSYTFVATDDASLNGSNVNNGSVSCNNVAANCNTSNVGPVLAAPTQNAPGGTVTRGANDFSLQNPASGNQFANSAASILASELFNGGAGGPGTNTNMVSETELQNATAATANTSIGSTTTLMLNFTVAAPGGTVTIAFDANPDLFAQVNDPALKGLFQANAYTTASFTILGSAGAAGQRATWAPDGILNAPGQGCTGVSGGLVCTEASDTQDLQRTVTVQPLSGTPATTDQYSHNGTAAFTSYSLTIAGLLSGNYQLRLNEATHADVQRISVPEPGSIALLGSGLLGLALMRRRKGRKA